MKDICSECGDRKNLNARGVCENRHGCQHRQFQHRARTERLLAEMDAREHVRETLDRQRPPAWDPGDNPIVHTEYGPKYNAWYRHPSNQDRRPPLAGGKDAMNKWIDHWLHRPEDWGE